MFTKHGKMHPWKMIYTRSILTNRKKAIRNSNIKLRPRKIKFDILGSNISI